MLFSHCTMFCQEGYLGQREENGQRKKSEDLKAGPEIFGEITPDNFVQRCHSKEKNGPPDGLDVPMLILHIKG